MTTPLSLNKGGILSLNKRAPALRLALIGLGWDASTVPGKPAIDLDACAFTLARNGKVRSTADLIFYNQPESPEGAVKSMGDNRTGSSNDDDDGDDEQILVDLSLVPDGIEKIAFTVTIYEFQKREQTFGTVRNAYIRLVDADTDTEVARYDLSEDASTETAFVFAELYRQNGEWMFKAVGQGYNGGLKTLCELFGLYDTEGEG